MPMHSSNCYVMLCYVITSGVILFIGVNEDYIEA